MMDMFGDIDKMKRNNKFVQKIALVGLLTALATVLSYM